MVEATRTARREQSWVRWVVISVWLLYLTTPVRVLLDQPSGWRQGVGLAALAGFVVVYLVGLALGLWRGTPPGRGGRDLGRRWVDVGLLVVLAALVVPGAGVAALHCGVFVAAAAAATLPRRAGVVVCVVVLATVVAGERLVSGWSTGDGVGLDVFLAGLAVFAIHLAAQRREALLDAQRELHELALDEERERIARDLHDILGHSLTVISLKAELAERLLDVDPVSTRTELEGIAALSREALGDVRATVRQQRGGSLAEEIAAARVALETAGIAADLPRTADGIPPRVREVFAWALREGVTNVIRHSGATRCTVSCSPDRLEVVDDGTSCAAPGSGGQGLAGIRERAAAVGAHVTATSSDHPRGYVLTVQVGPSGERP